MTIGFTGTSKGMTGLQRSKVRDLFLELGVRTLHHGDCIGADQQAHFIACGLPIKIMIHPPSNSSKRAFCADGAEIRTPKNYLPRDRDIAKEGVDGLIAAPSFHSEILRSGVWATVRYARRFHRQIWIVFPDGVVREE